jgi:hypothetical protein
VIVAVPLSEDPRGIWSTRPSCPSMTRRLTVRKYRPRRVADTDALLEARESRTTSPSPGRDRPRAPTRRTPTLRAAQRPHFPPRRWCHLGRVPSVGAPREQSDRKDAAWRRSPQCRVSDVVAWGRPRDDDSIAPTAVSLQLESDRTMTTDRSTLTSQEREKASVFHSWSAQASINPMMVKECPGRLRHRREWAHVP